MTMKQWLFHHQNQSQRMAFAGVFAILLPIFFPHLFRPLGRASPSLFSEWIAPRPRHLPLLKAALNRHIPIRQQSELWAPLPDQGWKACNEPTTVSCKLSVFRIQAFITCKFTRVYTSLPGWWVKPAKNGSKYLRIAKQLSSDVSFWCKLSLLPPLFMILLFVCVLWLSKKVCDAVAVAMILNATLVVPHLDLNPVWQDSSSFSDIFDVDHFINVLSNEVKIVKEPPREYSWSTREYYATGIRPTRIKTAPVHASAQWYQENVLPVLQSYGIVAIAPFSHRLAFDQLPTHLQRLRCKVNFEALAFVRDVKVLGDLIVNRLRNTHHQALGSGLRENIDGSGHEGSGKYVVLHLRFDKDMAAHSACDFGGGKTEKLALAKYRQVLWQGRVLNSQFTDNELRSQGRCPLTPEEIGLLLAALGFSNNTRLYLASHKVYGGEARIATLKQLFPLMEDKKTLASADELAKVEGKASLLAAVDYYVSLKSDIFISASPGNMHNALVGHRAYLNLKTIRPNMVLLGPLFLNKSMVWPDFEAAVLNGHRNRQGQIRLRKEKQSIFTYPAPDCMCKS
ncbi:unnamed protein product [Linum tenue]|uniref:O-fucosyltransferase family protein n=1 Tax=Linum tenue TaxID=586396 RepID=A0AAV0J7I7_9ROSI|nr:unnamed protein product [Linum tenue]